MSKKCATEAFFNTSIIHEKEWEEAYKRNIEVHLRNREGGATRKNIFFRDKEEKN